MATYKFLARRRPMRAFSGRRGLAGLEGGKVVRGGGGGCQPFWSRGRVCGWGGGGVTTASRAVRAAETRQVQPALRCASTSRWKFAPSVRPSVAPCSRGAKEITFFLRKANATNGAHNNIQYVQCVHTFYIIMYACTANNVKPRNVAAADGRSFMYGVYGVCATARVIWTSAGRKASERGSLITVMFANKPVSGRPRSFLQSFSEFSRQNPRASRFRYVYHKYIIFFAREKNSEVIQSNNLQR